MRVVAERSVQLCRERNYIFSSVWQFFRDSSGKKPQTCAVIYDKRGFYIGKKKLLVYLPRSRKCRSTIILSVTYSQTELVVRCVFFQDGEYLLLHKPKNKGGGYGLPGGHVEKDETPIEALIREIKEELDVRIKPDDLILTKVIHRKKGAIRKMHLVFSAKTWLGTPVNNEPKKCKGLLWASIDALPLDLSPTTFVTLYEDEDNKTYQETNFT